jgi:PTS system nitrogen regulatory IIA component
MATDVVDVPNPARRPPKHAGSASSRADDALKLATRPDFGALDIGTGSAYPPASHDESAMLLTVRDAARLLNTAESQIYRWVDDGHIPFQRVNDQIRFHRAELLEWATGRRLPVSVEMFHDEESDGGQLLPDFAKALEAGGIHYDVAGTDRESVLRAVLGRMPLPDDVDRDFLLDVLLSRETLGSTGIGDGIAIPHVRNPVVLNGAPALISLCFLKTPIDFAAIDGKPVHTIFSLVTPTIKGHLQLLAKLSWASHDPAFSRAVLERAKPEVILAEARRVEESFPDDGAGAEG